MPTSRSGISLAPSPHVQDVPGSMLKTIFHALAFAGPPDFIHAKQAQAAGGNILGDGIVVAVLDSGCRPSHSAFALASDATKSRVLPGRNFTDDGNNLDDSEDKTGHGTAVCGLAAAKSIAPIIAPAANILPLRISGPGGSDFSFVLDALSWLLDEGSDRGVSVVCVSNGDSGNWPSFATVATDGNGIRQEVAKKIRALRARDIPTVTASGNGYFANGKTEPPGMCFPAIMEECISVGAVFINSLPEKEFPQYGGAKITASSPKQITPFCQRLPETPNNRHFTRLFAPGASIKSAGIANDTNRTEDLFGTSAAAPCVTGVVALLQAWHKKNRNGKLPSCDKLERWLLQGADPIVDDAGPLDNVDNTGATYKYVNALGAMQAMIADPTP